MHCERPTILRLPRQEALRRQLLQPRRLVPAAQNPGARIPENRHGHQSSNRATISLPSTLARWAHCARSVICVRWLHGRSTCWWQVKVLDHFGGNLFSLVDGHHSQDIVGGGHALPHEGAPAARVRGARCSKPCRAMPPAQALSACSEKRKVVIDFGSWLGPTVLFAAPYAKKVGAAKGAWSVICAARMPVAGGSAGRSC